MKAQQTAAKEIADQVIVDIANYVDDYVISSTTAYETASYSFMDALGCALLALRFPACTRLLGSLVPDTEVLYGCRVPGTAFVLDPVQGAFNIGCMIRWLDYNDTWLAAEWGHPSDNLGGILAISDYLSQLRIARDQPPFIIKDILTAMIKAHEIQGIIALENSFNRVGLDHVVLVKVASAAVVAKLLGSTKQQIINTISNAWIDGQALRTYRHAPNTGSRKSWAAGDATSRGVRLALLCNQGEMGYPTALTAKTWGFYDALFRGAPFYISQAYGSYVMENILFKISFPAEFHAQTAVEAAFKLRPRIKDLVLEDHLDQIDKIVLTTHESAIRIIDKKGPLKNPADRDHCLQYMVAIALIYGELTADHYEDEIASDPRIDKLRAKMEVVEDKSFSADYLLPDKRSIANAIQIFFKDGSQTDKAMVEYPLGHKRRRHEAIPLLKEKFMRNLQTRFAPTQATEIFDLCCDYESLIKTPVNLLMEKLTIQKI